MLRLFIVGCPRAGTTLLQSLLLSSDSIVSFPESHFFINLQKCPRRIPPGIHGKRLVNQWLDNAKAIYPRKYWIGISETAAIDYFWKTLDHIAATKSTSGWLEKTPGHVHHIGLIQKKVPNAKFIHILRSHKDNIASLYLARQQWGDKRDAITTARNWFGHISKSLKYINHDNHCFISYEELVNKPEIVISNLSSFTGLALPEYESVDLRRHANQIIGRGEVWKSNNLKSEKFFAPRRRFSEVFTLDEQDEIDRYFKSISSWISLL